MSHVTELDEFNFHQKIADAGGIALVFFSGPHCSSCHHLKHVLNEEFQKFTEHFSIFSAFEIKADKAAALVNEFGVFHLPSMYLYKDCQFHCELHSEAVTTKLIEAIELALTEPAEEEP